MHCVVLRIFFLNPEGIFLPSERENENNKDQGSGAWLCAGLSLLKVQGKFDSNLNGAATAYICKHSACLHTQKCTHNVSTYITLVSQQLINQILVSSERYLFLLMQQTNFEV